MPARTPGLRKSLIAYALGFPEAWEDHPWGESVAKVGKKIFVFFGVEGGDHGASITVKLPQPGEAVLLLRCATPTGYGLGKAGWVTIDASSADCPPASVLREWIAESYRAVAPKKLAARVE